MDFLLILALIVFVLTRLGKKRKPSSPAGGASRAGGVSPASAPSAKAAAEDAEEASEDFPSAAPWPPSIASVGASLTDALTRAVGAAPSDPAAPASAPAAPAEGEHTPIAPSEEGAFSEQSRWIAEKHPVRAAKEAADPCRALPEEVLGSDRASRTAPTGAKRAVSPLKTGRRAVTQGIYWAQVLETRGGHNAWNRSASR